VPASAPEPAQAVTRSRLDAAAAAARTGKKRRVGREIWGIVIRLSVGE